VTKDEDIFNQACLLADVLDPAIKKDSEAWQYLIVYIVMNKTRSYSTLRRILPGNINGHTIEKCR